MSCPAPVVTVSAPEKTPTSYIFRCPVSDWPEKRVKFGFTTKGVAIAHHELWDSFYPLMLLARFSGPFWRKVPAIRIVFRYPILASVVEYFLAHAKRVGLGLTIQADLVHRPPFDLPRGRPELAFGGGKDSRLLFGLLRELGEDCLIGHAVDIRGCDAGIPNLLRSYPVRGTIAERLMPSIMRCPTVLYGGFALGETFWTPTWINSYDIAAYPAQVSLHRMLKGLGADVTLTSPLAGVPYNLVQKILHDRYPDVYRPQVSTPPRHTSEKNLHIALCKRCHGIPHDQHLDNATFRSLMVRFLTEQKAKGSTIQNGDSRGIIHLEMRAMLRRLVEHRDPLVSIVSGVVPESWNAKWIDYIHLKMSPDIDPRLLAILKNHAPVSNGPSTDAPVQIGPQIP